LFSAGKKEEEKRLKRNIKRKKDELEKRVIKGRKHPLSLFSFLTSFILAYSLPSSFSF
jgi:hypothetical protein